MDVFRPHHKIQTHELTTTTSPTQSQTSSAKPSTVVGWLYLPVICSPCVHVKGPTHRELPATPRASAQQSPTGDMTHSDCCPSVHPNLVPRPHSPIPWRFGSVAVPAFGQSPKKCICFSPTHLHQLCLCLQRDLPELQPL